MEEMESVPLPISLYQSQLVPRGCLLLLHTE
jgi:hypothetical protein